MLKFSESISIVTSEKFTNEKVDETLAKIFKSKFYYVKPSKKYSNSFELKAGSAFYRSMLSVDALIKKEIKESKVKVLIVGDIKLKTMFWISALITIIFPFCIIVDLWLFFRDKKTLHEGIKQSLEEFEFKYGE